jgi:hypothetical protein
MTDPHHTANLTRKALRAMAAIESFADLSAEQGVDRHQVLVTMRYMLGDDTMADFTWEAVAARHDKLHDLPAGATTFDTSRPAILVMLDAAIERAATPAADPFEGLLA